MRSKIHNPPLEREQQCNTHGAYLAKCYLGSTWTKCQSCQDDERAADEKAQQAQKNADALQAWKNKIEGSGIPVRFADSRFDTYKAHTEAQRAVLNEAKGYARDWVKNRSTGRSAVFVGSIGTGKNHLACAIAKHIMHKHHATVLFRTVTQAARSVRDTWVRGCTRSESDVIAEMCTPDLLILDEIGDATGTEWEKKVLFDIINERYITKKPTLLIGNITKERLAQVLGERVIDRLKEDAALVLNFDWESERPRIGAELSAMV